MKIAFLFPGQGAQKCGMGESFAKYDEAAKKVYENASKLLDLDMEELVFTENKKLDMTEYTQAAMVTTGIAMLKVIEKTALKADVCAGLSLGEYEALYLAKAISEEDAIVLARHRGKLMQEAVPLGIGTMAAVLNLDAAVIEDCLKDIENVWIANYNCPGQIVISGTVAAVEKAGEKLKEAGAKRALPLAVSVPSHCALMKPAADQLSVSLESITLKEAGVSVLNNVDVKNEIEADAIRNALVRQLYSPVRWTETVEKMAQNGVEVLVEVGPGKVLNGLTKRIVDSLQAVSVNDVKSLDSVEEVLA